MHLTIIIMIEGLSLLQSDKPSIIIITSDHGKQTNSNTKE